MHDVSFERARPPAPGEITQRQAFALIDMARHGLIWRDGRWRCDRHFYATGVIGRLCRRGLATARDGRAAVTAAGLAWVMANYGEVDG